MKNFRDIIFPPVCYGCEQEGAYLCKACKKKLQAHPELCPFCHRVSSHWMTCLNCVSLYPALTGIIIAFQYSGFVKKLIRQLKRNNHCHLAGFLSARLSILLQTHLLGKQSSKKIYISYVPSHRRRKHMTKGYNQSELLAKHLAEELDFPFLHLRKKHKRTRSQAKLSRRKRQLNLQQAFTLTETDELSGDEIILIVDDVTTTGSTLYELAETMKMRYPKITIRGIVLGRHGR